MIPQELRQRLEAFIADHECRDCGPNCRLATVESWITQIKAGGSAEHELTLLGLAYSAYVALTTDSHSLLESYQQALAVVVARHGGTLRIDLADLHLLKDGATMTTVLEDDGNAVVYRLTDPRLRS